jgi:hypothetical protein
MKRIYCGLILTAALFFAACSELFNGQTGEGTFIYLPPEGAVPAADTSFALPAEYPVLGQARIGVYNGAGKLIRNAGGSGKLEFTIPAGGPYWVDFSAPVIHAAEADKDLFPFVKSFGATVKIDAVTAGSTREITLPLRVRETAIMVPYRLEVDVVRRSVFVPFYELPAAYPSDEPSYFDKGTDEICFEFDPFGRLFAMERYLSVFNYVYRRETLGSQKDDVNTLPSSADEHGLAFNVLNGHLYYAYRSTVDSKLYISEYDVSNGDKREENDPSRLSSALITIDEEGFLYGVTRSDDEGYSITVREQGKYWEETPPSLSMNALAENLLGFKDDDGYKVGDIFDMKALNGYLYLIFYIQTTAGEDAQYYDYFAAVPLESVRAGNSGGAWFTGGQSVDQTVEDGKTIDPLSLAGFYGPQKFAGWGPDRIYVYDYNSPTSHTNEFHRIVEVDLRDRAISKAGLVAGVNNN